MCFNSKEQKLAAIIIISFIAINVFSVIYMFSRPVTDPPYVRPPASHHNINIMHGGGTEDLGYIDDDNISLHWIVWVTDTHLDGSLNGTLFKIYGQFLNYTYSSIHPFFTVNTGDLAGAQTRNYYIAIPQDFKALLKEYNSTVNHSLYNSDPNPLRYIDLAGNHDRNLDWGAQYFLNTTFTASRFHSIQHFISANFSAGETIYSFLDTAATLEAPAVPFGAEGSLDKDDFREYVAFLEAHKGAVNKLTFQHHYPWDTFGLAKDPHNHFYWDENYYNEKYGIDALFYGHFHFEGFENYRNVPYVLGDRWVHEMKDDLTGSDKEYPYVFHLISVDGQNINYHEVALDLQPHIIITNPGNPYFLDHADSITNTRGDGQVRTLVFANSSWSIISVEYQIDNGGWHAMKRYMGSKYLWESDRGTPSSPKVAIPNDGKDHIVNVRVLTNTSSTYYYQQAKVTYHPERKLFMQIILPIVIIALVAALLFINRDNFPFLRDDRPIKERYKALKEKKVNKRLKRNEERGKPWWLPYISGSMLISFFIVPWGIFPMFKTGIGLVFSFGLFNSLGYVFTMEPILYSVLRGLFIYSFLYWGTRTYWPSAIVIGASLMIVNFGWFLFIGAYNYGLPGLLIPGGYLDLLFGLILIFGNIKNTWLYRQIQAWRGK